MKNVSGSPFVNPASGGEAQPGSVSPGPVPRNEGLTAPSLLPANGTGTATAEYAAGRFIHDPLPVIDREFSASVEFTSTPTYMVVTSVLLAAMSSLFIQYREACISRQETEALRLVAGLRIRESFSPMTYACAMENECPDVLRYMVNNDALLSDNHPLFLELYQWAIVHSKELKFDLFWFKFHFHRLESTPLIDLCHQMKGGQNITPDYIKDFITSGVDPWEIAEGGVTALLFAAALDLTDIVNVLLRYNLPSRGDLATLYKNLGYAYQIALSRESGEMCRSLDMFADRMGISIAQFMLQEKSGCDLPAFIARPFKEQPVEEEPERKSAPPAPSPSPRGAPVARLAVSEEVKKGFHAAIKLGEVATVQKFLLSPTICLEDKVEVVLSSDAHGVDSFQNALNHGQERIAQMLMIFVAKFEVRLDGETILAFLQHAVSMDFIAVIREFIGWTSFGGKSKREIRELRDIEGFTLLAHACASKKVKAAELLLGDDHWDIFVPTHEGDTIGHLIAKGNLWSVLEKLLYSLPIQMLESTIKRLMSQTNHSGFTPLHTACQKGYHLMAMEFVELGADPRIKTREHDTPLSLARGSLYSRLIDFMEVVLQLPPTTTTSPSQDSPFMDYYVSAGELEGMAAILNFKSAFMSAQGMPEEVVRGKTLSALVQIEPERSASLPERKPASADAAPKPALFGGIKPLANLKSAFPEGDPHIAGIQKLLMQHPNATYYDMAIDGHCLFRAIAGGFMKIVFGSQEARERSLQCLARALKEVEAYKNQNTEDVEFAKILDENWKSLNENHKIFLQIVAVAEHSPEWLYFTQSLSDFLVSFMRELAFGVIHVRTDKDALPEDYRSRKNYDLLVKGSDFGDAFEMLALAYALGVNIKVIHLEHLGQELTKIDTAFHHAYNSPDPQASDISVIYRRIPLHYDLANLNGTI